MKANSYSPALRRVWLLIRGLFFEAEISKFDFVTLDGFARLVVFFTGQQWFSIFSGFLF